MPLGCPTHDIEEEKEGPLTTVPHAAPKAFLAQQAVPCAIGREPPGAVRDAAAGAGSGAGPGLEVAARQAFLRGASPASATALPAVEATAPTALPAALLGRFLAEAPPPAAEEVEVVLESACTCASCGKFRYARGLPYLRQAWS